jgi:hypothetical protein
MAGSDGSVTLRPARREQVRKGPPPTAQKWPRKATSNDQAKGLASTGPDVEAEPVTPHWREALRVRIVHRRGKRCGCK